MNEKKNSGCSPVTADTSKSEVSRWVEFVLLGVILVVGGWLRFGRVNAIEFQADEAYAAQLAVDFIRNGVFPQVGLMSSVGVMNPPLFIYFLIPMFWLNASPVFVSGCIAALGLGAVAMTWHVGRKYYGSWVGLVASAMFAVSPWAVIFSRKIWAQDFLPVLAAGVLWAMYALVLGKKRAAILWVVMLPLWMAQAHFAGVMTVVSVALILIWLRPRLDWRWAVAGLVLGLLPVVPYLKWQSAHGWPDARQARRQVGGGNEQWKQLNGMTVHPVSGYRLPSRNQAGMALAIMNAGQIEDVLGVTASPLVDRMRVHGGKPGGLGRYFENEAGWPVVLLGLQRLMCVAGLVWLVVLAVKSVKKRETFPFVEVLGDEGRGMWLLTMWLVLPPVLFWLAGMWTYMTYYAILVPGHFLVVAVAMRRAPVGWSSWRWWWAGVSGVLVLANVMYMMSFYEFVGRYGGAQGTFGSGLGYKLEGARFLASHGPDSLEREMQTQVRIAMSREMAEKKRLLESLGGLTVMQFNHEGRAELPQLDWSWLVSEAYRSGVGKRVARLRPDEMVMIWDRNREAFTPEMVNALMERPQTNFGPIRLVMLERGGK